MDEKTVKATCSECGHITEIPIQRIYDGFEGSFHCEECGAVLDKIEEALDD